MRGAPIDPCLLAGLALLGGALAPFAPGPALAATVVLVGLVTADRPLLARVATAILVFGALGIGALRAHRAVELDGVARQRADRALPQMARCSGSARVDSSPVLLHDVLRWDATMVHVVCDGQPTVFEGLVRLYGGPADLARGDVVDVIASLAPPERFWNLSEGDPRPRLAHGGVLRTGSTFDVRRVRRGRGPLALVDRARARVRARIDATFRSDLGAMARALVLGESDLAADDDRSFRASGLSHLLAVSGMHLVLVLAIAVRSLESLLVRIEPAAARFDVGRPVAFLGIMAAWVYAEFAGAGGSTLRAAWMATASLGVRALGRRTDAARAFGLSAAIMALLDPLVAFDLSFALSAAATGGLLAFGRPMQRWVSGAAPRCPEVVASAIGTSLAATVACVPILARFTPTVPLAGVAANLLAVPVGEAAALPLCLVHAATWWWPAVERGAAAAACGALVLVREVARAASNRAVTLRVPQPTGWQLAACAVALGAAAVRRHPRVTATLAGAACVLLELRARAYGAPRGLLRATFLDVGQGDAAIVDLPDGEAIVIDGGGLVGSPIDVGQRVLDPELRARRRSAIALVLLTHPHPDHYGGLVTGLAQTQVGALWDTGQGEREHTGGTYADLLASLRAAGTPIVRPADFCGTHALGGAVLEVLEPCPDFSSDDGPNDNSIVVRISYGSRAFLFVGDAERGEEARLLAKSRDRLRADVLKVGHHGSRTSSTPAFVSVVAPEHAIVSVGRRNRFGHPSPLTLATLDAAGVRTWRTDLEGAVEAATDGRTLQVRSLFGLAAAR
jgi:competence protein ComEC